MIGQFAWLTGGRLTAAFLQALTFGALAIVISPAALGVVGSAVAVLVVLQAAWDLGVSTFLVRTRAADPSDGRVRGAIVLNRLTTVPLLVSSALVAVALGALHDEVSAAALLPLAVWAAAERNAETVAGVAIADGEATLAVANLVARRLVAAIGYVALLRLGTEPVLAFGTAMAAGALLSVVWLNMAMRERLSGGRGARLRQVLRDARPYWANTLAIQARNLDVPVVAFVGGPVTAGVYSLASRMTVPLRLVPTSLAVALLPHAARSTSPDARRLVVRQLAWLVGVVSALYVVLAALVPLLVSSVPVLRQFEEAVLPAQILLVSLPFGAVASVATSLLQADGMAGFVSRTAALMSAVCLVGAAVGALLAGAAGAAAAFGLALVLQAALLASRALSSHRQLRRDVGPVGSPAAIQEVRS